MTVVVIDSREMDTETCLVIFGLNSFEVFTQSFCELSFSLAYIDLVARGALYCIDQVLALTGGIGSSFVGAVAYRGDDTAT